VGAFGTASAEPADVSLQGQINGSAPLTITGSVNPLAPMAFVDLTLKADSVELTGFSPYTTKYTGYPIVNGSLSADVHYNLNQGNLAAENHIVIDQLTFGDKVENTTAINLPIRLAVAILKDSNGVIDLHVPISGSLSDPQFSIASVVLHAFWSLIVKAATSPFSLIGAALGSKEDLSQVNFAPGYALLTPDATSKLDTVVKALQQRSNLKLNIQGCADPSVDRDALPAAMVDRAVREQKLKSKGGATDPWDIQVAPDEYAKYLGRAYSAASFEKPKNFLGLSKSLPTDEMKKLMIANTKVTDADLHKLADARADVVRKYLAAKQVDASRMTIEPPSLEAAKNGAKRTRAELGLE
jgi:outer membrane protein OmpA-like peptidoglycan-associated protein